MTNQRNLLPSILIHVRQPRSQHLNSLFPHSAQRGKTLNKPLVVGSRKRLSKFATSLFCSPGIDVHANLTELENKPVFLMNRFLRRTHVGDLSPQEVIILLQHHAALLPLVLLSSGSLAFFPQLFYFLLLSDGQVAQLLILGDHCLVLGTVNLADCSY